MHFHNFYIFKSVIFLIIESLYFMGPKFETLDGVTGFYFFKAVFGTLDVIQ